MSSVIFVHGTGVRQAALDVAAEHLASGLREAGVASQLIICDWGSTVGARLRMGGVSVPHGRVRRDVADEGPQGGFDSRDPVAVWAVLDLDPLAEVEVFSTVAGDELPPGARSPDAIAARAATAIARDVDVLDAAIAAGLAADLSAAVETIMRASSVAGLADMNDLNVAPMLGRAVVAEAQRRSDNRLSTYAPIHGDDRDRLVAAIAASLAPTGERGALRDTAIAGARFAWAVTAARPVERRRRAITDAASPAAGDIMRYLARGDDMRAQVLACINAAPAPVVVVGHSLGGIIALEAICHAASDNVAALVTVGSQASYLHELGALPTLVGDLPAALPAWTNVYDERDLLAFLAEPIFGAQVHDIRVDNRCPFPRSHSAYLTNPHFYRILADVVHSVVGHE